MVLKDKHHGHRIAKERSCNSSQVVQSQVPRLVSNIEGLDDHTAGSESFDELSVIQKTEVECNTGSRCIEIDEFGDEEKKLREAKELKAIGFGLSSKNVLP